MMPMNASVMLIVGAVVLVHGVVLLTPAAERLGRTTRHRAAHCTPGDE